MKMERTKRPFRKREQKAVEDEDEEEENGTNQKASKQDVRILTCAVVYIKNYQPDCQMGGGQNGVRGHTMMSNMTWPVMPPACV